MITKTMFFNDYVFLTKAFWMGEQYPLTRDKGNKNCHLKWNLTVLEKKLFLTKLQF